MRHRVSTTMDADALQADVMRFMAIIAFCLIAILALVRQIEPETVAAVSVPAVQTAASAEPQAAASQPMPVVPVVPSRSISPANPEPVPQVKSKVAPQVEAKVALQAVPEPVTADAALEVPGPGDSTATVADSTVAMAPIPSATAPDQPKPVALPKPVPPALTKAPTSESVEPQDAPADTDRVPPEEGLTLRFATDQDFLRLVAKGDIQVYLFGGAGAHALQRDYRFVEAPSPRELFEVMPTTVPALIRQRASGVKDIDQLRYGLRFPPQIEAQLSEYVAQVASGALLIDRYGRVTHVPAD